MAGAKRLKNLVISEVSSVDRGAGEGVKVLLMKRADADIEKIAPQLDDAITALKKSFTDIEADKSINDKATARAEVLKEFTDHVAELTGEKEPAMPTEAEVQKRIDDAVSTAVTKAIADSTAAIAKLQFDLAWRSMKPEHQEFGKAMSDEDKKKFAAKTDAERDADCDEAKKSAIQKLDPEIQAKLAKADETAVQLQKLQEKQTVADFEKRATDLGLEKQHGEVLRKAYSGDAEAQVKLDALLKGLAEQVRTGRVFAEFGNGGPGKTVTAMDEMTAKAAELKKADPKLTEAQAFDKAYNDPANTEIAQRIRADQMQKIHRAA